MKHILIAEDTESNLFLLEKILKNYFKKRNQNNFMLFIAKDGIDVLKIFKEHKIDIIFMDTRMPYMDGIETIVKIRSIESDIHVTVKNHVPIVSISAATYPEDVKNAFNSGSDDFLEKPIDMEKFETILDKYLGD